MFLYHMRMNGMVVVFDTLFNKFCTIFEKLKKTFFNLDFCYSILLIKTLLFRKYEK